MRILYVTSRFPERQRKGDQSRAFAFIRELATRHSIGVLSADEPSSREAARELSDHCRVTIVRCGRRRRLVSALASAMSGEPAQVGWMMPRRAWRATQDHAQTHDVVVMNTVRSVRGPLPVPTVIDYVDALSWNMEARSQGPEALAVRWFAREEARRLKRWEERAAGWANASIVTSPEVAEVLPGGSHHRVIPVAWEGDVIDDLDVVRDIDLILTGDMRYPPNREGAYRLSREILPRIRRRLPEASCWIVGRHAATLDVSGVELRSDVPDTGEFLRRARVAISPVRGRGSPYKVLEAAANGAAVVALPWALNAYGLDGEMATDVDSFVRAAVRLLDDDDLRRRRALEGIAVARTHSLTALGQSYERAIMAAAREG